MKCKDEKMPSEMEGELKRQVKFYSQNSAALTGLSNFSILFYSATFLEKSSAKEFVFTFHCQCYQSNTYPLPLPSNFTL